MTSKVTCAKCGACTTVCPVYQATGRESLTARGRMHLLGKLTGQRHSAAGREIFSCCLLCGACRQACPRQIDVTAKVIEARNTYRHQAGQNVLARSLVGKCLSRPPLLDAMSDLLQLSAPLLEKLPTDSGLRLKLGLFKPAAGPVEKEAEPAGSSAESSPGLLLFSGCLARHLLPGITASCHSLVKDRSPGGAFSPAGQKCCGLAAFGSGNLEEARRLARANIEAYSGTDLPILTSCGSCYSHLLTYPDLFADNAEWRRKAEDFSSRLRELAAFLNEKSVDMSTDDLSTAGGGTIRVVYHDPCHLKFIPGMIEHPRRLLESLPGIEILDLPNGSRCCGFGGMFSLAHPDLSAKISGLLVDELAALEPDLVVTSCSGCLLQLRQQLAAKGLTAIEIAHLSVVLAGRTAKQMSP